MHPVEINAASPGRSTVAQLLAEGRIVLLRDIDAIRHFRAAIEDYVAAQAPVDAANQAAFYTDGALPGISTVLAMSRAIKTIRTDRFLSRCLAPFIAELGFGAPVRLDGGIPRLVLPTELVAAARQSGLFADEDFKRLKDDGPTEVFMPAPANIHRDYNRQHYLLQCNMWFPLHDSGEDEVVRIYPEAYQRPIFDMDATEENLRQLGDPLHYRLGFGDAILFHGEHLHTSPVSSGRFRRRFSYDFRIASYSLDDTRHYRDLFLDLRNFPAQPPPKLRLGGHQIASTADDCALPAILELERSTNLDETGLTRIGDIFDSFPFAEDRYALLATRALSRRAPLNATRASQTILDHSPHWFWLAVAGQSFLAMGDRIQAEKAFRKSHDLAGRQATLPDFMPVAYPDPPTQLLPNTVRQFCEHALEKIGTTASGAA